MSVASNSCSTLVMRCATAGDSSTFWNCDTESRVWFGSDCHKLLCAACADFSVGVSKSKRLAGADCSRSLVSDCDWVGEALER